MWVVWRVVSHTHTIMLALRSTKLALAPRLALQSARAFVTSDGFLHKTTIPTFHFQKSLPRLKVPELDETLEKHLTALKPVVTAEQFAVAEAATTDFKNGPGPDLHKALIARDEADPDTCFYGDWWNEMYLSDRQPIPINYNPQLTFNKDPVASRNTQLARATNFIVSSVRFCRTLDHGHLEPEIFHTKPDVAKSGWYAPLMSMLPESVAFYGSYFCGAYPLDIRQFKNLFRSTRIPREVMDELSVPDTESKHVIVQRGSSFYKVDVMRADGTEVPSDQVHGALAEIANAAPAAGALPLGILTTMKRDEWAAVRAEMDGAGGECAASLQAIDAALFVLVMEDEVPDSDKALGSLMLHGDGRNRWFDKSFSVIVAGDGQAAINFEHAWGDGVCVLKYANAVFADAIDPVSSPAVEPSAPEAPPQLLGWGGLPAGVGPAVGKAGEEFDKWLRTLSVEIAKIPEIKKGFAKSHKLGEDGLLQMVMQLAHYKLHGKVVSTYESASTCAFKGGRTECIRSASEQAQALCAVFADPAAADADKEAALREATANHGTLTKDALFGKGVDRHLFALRKMAELGEGEVPGFFTTEAMDVWGKIILSTSTLSSAALDGGGFGPVNDECYGMGYGQKDDYMGFIVSTYRPDGPAMAAALTEAALEVKAVLENNAAAKTV